MQRNTNNQIGMAGLAIALAGGLPAYGGGSTSVDGTNVRITVEWSQVGNPSPVNDFSVTFTDSAAGQVLAP